MNCYDCMHYGMDNARCLACDHFALFEIQQKPPKVTIDELQAKIDRIKYGYETCIRQWKKYIEITDEVPLDAATKNIIIQPAELCIKDMKLYIGREFEEYKTVEEMTPEDIIKREA